MATVFAACTPNGARCSSNPEARRRASSILLPLLRQLGVCRLPYRAEAHDVAGTGPRKRRASPR